MRQGISTPPVILSFMKFCAARTILVKLHLDDCSRGGWIRIYDDIFINGGDNMPFLSGFCQNHSVNLRTEIRVLFFEETCFFWIIHCI